MYKDKEKQREANRQANKRYRQNKQGITPERGITVSQEAMVIPERTAQGNIRVSKPGDDDYDGICHKDDLNEWSGTDVSTPKLKRGKDIKTFADLPPDVQQTIEQLSIIDGKVNQTIKANRTAIAVNYQHLFPGRYQSTGI